MKPGTFEGHLETRDITLRRPLPGQHAVIPAENHAVLLIAFPIQSADLSSDGDKLIFTFPDGGSITVPDFFTGDASDMPQIRIAGRQATSAEDFLKEYDPELYASTRASTGKGSGDEEYYDDPGALLQGVDKLGKLGTDYWSRESAHREWPDGIPTHTGDETPVIIPGALRFSFAMFEDGEPSQNTLFPGGSQATGPRNSAFQSGYDPDTGMSIPMRLDGAPQDVTVGQIIIGPLPDASQGIIMYQGRPLALGQNILNPDLGAFSFKPAENFSGDANFSFSYRLTSPVTGPASAMQDASAVLHVDSVADLPDAASEASGRLANGNNLTAPGATVHDDGWARQTVREEPPVDLTFTVKADFHDLDGSEKGWIDVRLPQGFSIPEGSGYLTVKDGNDTYARIPVPELLLLRSAGGHVEVPVTITMGKDAAPSGNVFDIRVIAQEQDSRNTDGYSTSDNTAVRVIEQDVNVTLFPGSLKVSAGWAYEGDKNGGEATADLAGIGIDPGSTTAAGAPITFEFSGGAMTGGTVSIDPAAGALYVDGVPAAGTNGVYVFTAQQLTGNHITFMPAPGYTDKDASVSYTIQVRGAGGGDFTVSGKTTAVLDAVADAATGTAASAVAGADNTTLDVTVNAAFADTDGSERHFILVEKKDGWDTVEPHEVITVYYDAAGHPLQPVGVDAVTGRYTYDTGLAVSSKEFFRVDVTDRSANAGGAATDYVVHMRPDFAGGDTILATGTLAEEAYPDRSGFERDVANNQAYTFGNVAVNLVNSAASQVPMPAYEEHNPGQYLGGTSIDAQDGTIVVGLFSNGGAASGGDVVDTAPGRTITMTFSFAGGHPGSFLYNGVNYVPGDRNYVQTGAHEYTLTLPADVLSGTTNTFTVRYNPLTNDDTNLENIRFTLPVISPGTGFTGMVSTDPRPMIVDAVADKPVEVGLGAYSSDGNTAAISGGTVEVAVKARFNDYQDGSEQHYIVLDLGSGFSSVDTSTFPPGYAWRVMADTELTAAGLDKYADADRYAVVQVPNDYLKQHGGLFDASIKAGVDVVSKDGTLALNIVAVAVEHPGDGGDLMTNNIAETPGASFIVVHAVTSDPVLNVKMAYEDDMRLEHISQDGSSGAPLSISGIDASENLTGAVISFKADAGSLFYNGNPLTPGSHDLGSGLTFAVGIENGNYVIRVSGGSQTVNAAGAVGKLTFVPADNYNDRDVPFSFNGSVVDKASGETKDFGPKQGTIIVDAVAQQPENTDGSVSYEDGRTAAFGSLTLTATASFRDVADGTERHYLLIEAKSYFDVTGLNLTTVAYGSNGQPLTPRFSGDAIAGWLNPDPASGTDVNVVPARTADFIQVPVDEAIAKYDAAAGGAQTIGDFTVTREADGSFSVSYTAHIPVKTGTVASDIHGDTVITGGMAVDSASPAGGDGGGGREGYQYNNVGYDFDPSATVNISVVETRIVTLLMGRASEQNAPDANVGDYTPADGAGILVVRETPGGGDYGNEQVTVNFTYHALYQDANGKWVLPGTIEYNGQPVAASIDPATGLVTATVVLSIADAASIINKTSVSTDPDVRAAQVDGSAIRFVPSGDTFNEADVNLRYTTSVQDVASGASMNMIGGSGTVLVDAVADLPIISNVAWAHDQGGQFIASSSPEVTLNLDVAFPDTGTHGVASEGQYILVQKIPGMDLSNDFKAAVARAGFTIIDQPEGDVLYYRIPAAYFQESAAGSHDYHVSLPMVLQGGIADIEGFTPPDILALAVVDTAHGGEVTASNNTAQAEVDLPPLNFAVVTSGISGGSTGVYEGDAPNAYEGDYSPAGGNAFGLGLHFGASLNGGSEQAVGDIAVTYADTRGTLYYREPDPGEGSGFRLVAVQNGGSIPPAYANSLVFIPKDTGDSSADTDVPIHYSLTVEDPASGAQKTLTGDYTIIIDSVAEQPLDVKVDNVTYADGTPTVGHNESITLDISARFPDFEKSADGHADHYILIQRPGEYWTTDAPGVDIYTAGGMTYFRIPVSSFDASGNASVSVTLRTPPDGSLLYDNARPITVNAMTVDRDPGKGPLPDGDRGITYDNNWAYGRGADVIFTYADPTGHKYFTVDPLYEDNTPYGNQLDTDGNPVTTRAGGGVHLNTTIDVPDGSGGYTPKDVSDVTLSWDSSRGDLYIDGVKMTPPGGGTVSVTIPAGDFGKDIVFRTPDNNSDQDFGAITGTFRTADNTGPYTDTAAPVVDAVAQVPTDMTAAADYGDRDGVPLSAVTPGANVNIQVATTFHDLDGSENLYVLVEVKPDWGNPMGYPVVTGPNGIAYYQVPVDPSEVDPATGQVSKTITLKTPADSSSGAAGDHGRTDFTLHTGAMTVEDTSKDTVNGIPRGEEIRDDNNIAYNLDSSVSITTSSAESNPVIHVTNAYAGSDRDGDGIADSGDSSNVYITGLDSASDTISKVELSYNGGHGELRLNGRPLEGMSGVTVSTNPDGTKTLAITDSGVIGALTAGGASGSPVQYVPTDANADDIAVTSRVTVSDLFSGDTKQVSGGGRIIVDAVAQHPENVSLSVNTADGAVGANAPVPVSVTGSFPDLGQPGVVGNHVLGVQQIDGWTLDGPMPAGVSIQSYNGVTYYAISVDEYGNGGSPALTRNPDGSYTFNITLKAPDVTHDVTNAATIQGGALTIADDQGSSELTYANNLSVVAKDAPLNIGVVETPSVDFVFAPVTEDSAAGSAVSLDTATLNALSSHNEKLTDATLTFAGDFSGKKPGDLAGTVIYDGKAYTLTVSDSGTATVSVDFGSAGYDASRDFRVVWGAVQTDGNGAVQFDGNGNPVVTAWNHTGQNMTVTAESTVTDKASGATESVSGKGGADFTPVADAPAAFTATDPENAAGAGQEVTFTVSGRFADTDGSELHYLLVEQQDGWTGEYNTITLDGKNYFMVPVLSTSESPSVTVALTTPPDVTGDTSATLAVGGLAKDGASTNYTLSGNTSTITIGVVTATGVSLTMADTGEDAHTQMRFSLDGGENDALSSITVTDLHGGVIVDAAGKVLISGAPAELDPQTALGGGYYYLPPANASGNFSVSYHAVVADQASGASREFDGGAGDVAVAPVTDTPENPLGTDGALVFEPGHTASAPVHLQAQFPDNDGSEAHFFLVTLPDGAHAPSGWSQVTDSALLEAAGLSGQSVYRVDADASGAASFNVGLQEYYGGGGISFVAGSVEKANLNDGTPDYQFTAQDTVNLPATGEINLPPEVQNITGFAGGFSGNELNGAFALNDPDGDRVIIAGVSAGGAEGTLDSDGNHMVRGVYGDFVVHPDGSYTYNLFDPKGSGQDVLEVTLGDQYGATSTSTISVDVTPVSGTNPLAATLYGTFSLLGGIDPLTAAAVVDPLTVDSGSVDMSGLPVVPDAAPFIPGSGPQQTDAELAASLQDTTGTNGATPDAAHAAGQDAGTPLAGDSGGLTSFEIDQSPGHEEQAAEIITEIKNDFGG